MPRLGKELFEPQEPAISDDVTVWTLSSTGEVFSTYEAFLARLWSTQEVQWRPAVGRAKKLMPFDDAVEAEERHWRRLSAVSGKTPGGIPQTPGTPGMAASTLPSWAEAAVASFVHHTDTGGVYRTAPVVHNVFKNVFFVDEPVDVRLSKGSKKTLAGQVLKVLPAESTKPAPTSDVTPAGVDFAALAANKPAPSQNEAKENENIVQPAAPKDATGAVGSALAEATADPAQVQYVVKIETEDEQPEETMVLPASKLRHRKGHGFTKDTISDFLRTSCQRAYGDSGPWIVEDRIRKRHNIPDKVALTPKTPAVKGQSRSGDAPKRKQKTEDEETAKAKLKMLRHYAKTKKWEGKGKMTPKKSKKEIQRLEIVLKEHRERKKAERKRQAEEEKRKEKERKEAEKEFMRPREDTTLEDSKDLPVFEALEYNTNPKVFARAVGIMEWLMVYGDAVELQNQIEYPFNLDDIERALDGQYTAGFLADLVLHLLYTHVCDDLLETPARVLGVNVKHLAMDTNTVSELLRRVFETSQHSLLPSAEEKAALEYLKTASFFSMPPDMKLTCLERLCNLLLDSGAVQDAQAEAEDKVKELKAELKEELSNISQEKKQLLQQLKEKKEAIKEKIQDAEKRCKPGKEDAVAALKERSKSDEKRLMEIHKDEAAELQTRSDEIERLYRQKIFGARRPIRVVSLGQDRLRRRYWLLESLPGVVIEPSAASIEHYRTEMSKSQSVPEQGDGDMDMESFDAEGWAHIQTVEELDELIQSLNVRGIREKGLKEKIELLREDIETALRKHGRKSCGRRLSGRSKAVEDADETLFLAAREVIIDLASRLYSASLLSDKFNMEVFTAWTKRADASTTVESLRPLLLEVERAIPSRFLRVQQMPEPADEEEEEEESDGPEDIGLGTDDQEAADARDRAFVKLMDPRANAEPEAADAGATTDDAGQTPNEQDQEQGMVEADDVSEDADVEADQADDAVDAEEALVVDSKDGYTIAVPGFPVLSRWRALVINATSPSQLAMLAYILDASVNWDKSLLRARCRRCRKGTDPEKLLLCDKCDGAYHLFCLKPRLNKVPEGDWFCPQCKPKMATPRKRRIGSDDESDGGTRKTRGRGRASRRKLADSEPVSSAESDDEDARPTRKKRSNTDDDVLPASKRTRKGRGRVLKLPPEDDDEEGEDEDQDAEDSGSDDADIAMDDVDASGPEEDGEEEDDSDDDDDDEEDNGEGAESSDDEVVQVGRPRRTAMRGATRSSSGARQTRAASRSNVKQKPTTRLPRFTRGSDARASCERVLRDVMKLQESQDFLEPVNVSEAPDYNKVIDNPMDLNTIREKLNLMAYKGVQDFSADVLLVIHNAIEYNGSLSDIGKDALSLLEKFKASMADDGFDVSNVNPTGVPESKSTTRGRAGSSRGKRR